MRLRLTLDGVLTVVLSGCAIAMTALVVRREFVSPKRAREPRGISESIANSTAFRVGGQTIGAKAAPVAIVEFSDFQCPYCATLSTRLVDVRRKYGDSISVRYRHFPLTRIHDFALMAAVASECAGDQGRFESFHDALFTRQAEIGKIAWSEFARMAAVPNDHLFQQCLDSKEIRKRVDKDVAAALKLELQGTPAVLVNDQLIRGAPTLAELDSLIALALSRR